MAKTKKVTSRQIEALTPFVRTFEIMGFQCGQCPQSEPDSPHGSLNNDLRRYLVIASMRCRSLLIKSTGC